MTDPLLGRILKLECPDGASWTLSRFNSKLSKYVYLMTALHPQTGEPNKTGCFILDLRLIRLQPNEDFARGQIFEDLEALRAYLDWMEEPPAEKVIKLVTK